MEASDLHAAAMIRETRASPPLLMIDFGPLLIGAFRAHWTRICPDCQPLLVTDRFRV